MWRTLCVMAALWGAPAQACRLALVLALDVSSSVDASEDRLQRAGLAAALLDPDVQAAFFAVSDPVALYVFEWSGRYDQAGILPDWRIISTPGDLRSAALQITNSTRSRSDMPTALGHAMGHAATVLGEAPGCLFHTIDVSGDGQNNEGFSASLAYAAFPFQNVTVNALVVATGDAPPSELVTYFEAEVIRGPGAFIEVAHGFDDYADAMRRKLLRELSVQVIGQADALPQPRG